MTSIITDPNTGDLVKLSSFYQGLREAAFYQMVDHPNIIKVKTIDYNPDAKVRSKSAQNHYEKV